MRLFLLPFKPQAHRVARRPGHSVTILSVNPLGVKGIAELAIVGVAATIANAIFHATGKCIRELPITPDKLLL
jgi:CO/xanthine dehydrogenase Mo-binding subunit